MIIFGLILRSVLRILEFAYNVFKTPLALGTIVIMLAYYPDVLQWVLMKIGELQIKCFAIVLNAIMPDIFGSMGTNVTSWHTIWQQGLSLLPSNLVQILNACWRCRTNGTNHRHVNGGFHGPFVSACAVTSRDLKQTNKIKEKAKWQCMELSALPEVGKVCLQYKKF